MASLFNWILRKNEGDYEKILADLDEQIRKSEIRLAEYSIRKNKWTFVWTFYAMLFYFLASILSFLYFRTASGSSVDAQTIGTLGLFYVVFPMFIIFIRRSIHSWFDSQQKYEMEYLEKTRAAQKDKIEELKKKTAYYVTQGLIERYDTPVKGQTPRASQQKPPPATLPRMAGVRAMNLQVGTGTPQQLRPHSQQHQKLNPNENPFVAPAPVQTPQANSNNLNQPGTQSHPIPAVHQQQPHQTPRTWFDKFLEAMVGEPDGPQNRYALICESCFTHNGLVLPHEYLSSKFRCMKCGQLNEKKRSESSSVSSVVESELKKQQEQQQIQNQNQDSRRQVHLVHTLRHSQSLSSLHAPASPTNRMGPYRNLDSSDGYDSPTPSSPLRKSTNDAPKGDTQLLGASDAEDIDPEEQITNPQKEPASRSLEASLLEATTDDAPSHEMETDDTSSVVTDSAPGKSQNTPVKPKSSSGSLRKRKGGSTKKKR